MLTVRYQQYCEKNTDPRQQANGMFFENHFLWLICCTLFRIFENKKQSCVFIRNSVLQYSRRCRCPGFPMLQSVEWIVAAYWEWCNRGYWESGR